MTTVWLALFILSVLVYLASLIWVLVLAYRESLTWGLVSTFVPFGVVAFAVKFWPETKRAVIPCAAALLFATVSGLAFSASKVNTNLGIDSGGADLWAGSSGFEAMADTSTSTFDTDAAEDPTPDEALNTNFEEDTTETTPPSKPDPSSGSALDQLTVQNKTATETPTPRPRRGRRHSIVPLENLPQLQGERAALILKDGERIFGVIEQVGPTKVVVRKLVGGGSILFTLRRCDIMEIQTHHWR